MGLTTSNAAPVLDMLRTVQSMVPPSNEILPAFKTRCRDAIRFSFIGNPGNFGLAFRWSSHGGSIIQNSKDPSALVSSDILLRSGD
mgnify:CR=1 FL=1